MKKHVVLVAATAIAALLLPGLSHAGPELLPNGGFEESAFEAGVAHGALPQPILPTGWVFEGAAGLFDHSPNDKRSGLRSAAISIPASGKRDLCGPEVGCVSNPANIAKDATSHLYSVTPHWRTALPVAITGGASYRFEGWTRWILATEGEGSIAQVRWLDANMVPIRQDILVQKLNSLGLENIPWSPVSRSITAPNAARHAHILLGATDDVWISQVLWDDVSFKRP